MSSRSRTARVAVGLREHHRTACPAVAHEYERAGDAVERHPTLAQRRNHDDLVEVGRKRLELAAPAPAPAREGAPARQHLLDDTHVVVGRHSHGHPVAHRGHDARLGRGALREVNGVLRAKRPLLARHQRKPAVEPYHAAQVECAGILLAQAFGHATACLRKRGQLCLVRSEVAESGHVLELVGRRERAQDVGSSLAPGQTAVPPTPGRARDAAPLGTTPRLAGTLCQTLAHAHPSRPAGTGPGTFNRHSIADGARHPSG